MDTLIRNWWMLALRGLFAVLLGVMAFVWPGVTLATLVLFFGAYAFADGVFALISTFQQRERWWALALEGVMGIGTGVVTFFWPAITALALLYIIAAWAVVTGVFEVAAAARLRKEMRGEWLLALSGLASVAFGVLLILRPGPGALAVVWLMGSYALIFGALMITLGFRLRGLDEPSARDEVVRKIPISHSADSGMHGGEAHAH